MGQLRTANRRRRRAGIRSRPGWPAGTGMPPFLSTSAMRPGLSVGRRRTARRRPPVEIVGTATIPGGGRLHLAKCGGDFSIQFRSDELMGSRDHVSEDALATMTFDRSVVKDDPVLIGGLGMGFTLRAALGAWGEASAVHVAELVPEVVAWAEGPLAHIFEGSLADPRVVIELADVHDVIDKAEGRFGAILLDVDNGPDGFMRLENDRLYCNWGLRSAYRALVPGGMLAIWSAYADATFHERLAAAGFAVEEVTVPAYVGSAADRYRIWFAARPMADRPVLAEQGQP